MVGIAKSHGKAKFYLMSNSYLELTKVTSTYRLAQGARGYKATGPQISQDHALPVVPALLAVVPALPVGAGSGRRRGSSSRVTGSTSFLQSVVPVARGRFDAGYRELTGSIWGLLVASR